MEEEFIYLATSYFNEISEDVDRYFNYTRGLYKKDYLSEFEDNVQELKYTKDYFIKNCISLYNRFLYSNSYNKYLFEKEVDISYYNPNEIVVCVIYYILYKFHYDIDCSSTSIAYLIFYDYIDKETELYSIIIRYYRTKYKKIITKEILDSKDKYFIVASVVNAINYFNITDSPYILGKMMGIELSYLKCIGYKLNI